MRLLVAFDGSEGAQAALREAGIIARASGAELLLLRVLNPMIDASEVVAPTRTEAIAVVAERERPALEAAAAASGVDADRVSVEVALSEHGEDVAATIERIASEREATMIVISSRRVTSLAGTVLGSVTRHVLSHAPCPVLVVRE